MKKIFIVTFCSLFTFTLSAQLDEGDSRFAIVGGLNYAYPVGDDMEDYIDDFDDMIDDYDDAAGWDAEGGIKPRLGMHLGIAYDYFFRDYIALSTGLIYSQKGFCVKYSLENEGSTFQYTGNTWDNYYSGMGYGYYTNVSSKGEFKVATNLNYIDIPIGIKYATDEGLEVSGGILFAILSSESVVAKADIDNDGNSGYSDSYYESEWEDNFGNDYEDAYGDDPEGSISGWHLGVGKTFNEKFNVAFKLQKTGNFGEIYDENDNRNLTVQLSTSIYF